jgi:hemerythrin-like domain-containing protein
MLTNRLNRRTIPEGDAGMTGYATVAVPFAYLYNVRSLGKSAVLGVARVSSSKGVESPSSSGCDVSDMLVVHGLLRHVYGEAPQLVADVTDNNPARARIVADHLSFLNGFLHNHHRSEDLLIWDELSSRSPGCTIHVELMKRQHHAVGEVLASLEPRLEAWRSSGSRADAAQVTELLQELSDSLFSHLGQEEDKILPEIASTWTQAEWDRVGKHAMKGLATKDLMVIIGLAFESLPPVTREESMRNAPTPLRIMYRLYGQRRYNAYRRRLYGLAS